jgi:hypothetical protein
MFTNDVEINPFQFACSYRGRDLEVVSARLFCEHQNPKPEEQPNVSNERFTILLQPSRQYICQRPIEAVVLKGILLTVTDLKFVIIQFTISVRVKKFKCFFDFSFLLVRQFGLLAALLRFVAVRQTQYFIDYYDQE